jgi:FkbM family methyltransferase
MLGTTLKEKLYFSPFRVLLRHMGISRALALVSFMRSVGCQIRVRVRPRESVVVHVRDLTARFLISSPLEMRRIETLGSERKLLRRLIQETKPGDVAYDIGTNIGLYTVFLAKAVGEEGCVVGFEPELRSYHRCKDNLGINSLTNVQLLDLALGKEEKQVDLVVYEQPESGVHHVVRGEDGSAGSRLQSIRQVIGDRLIVEQVLPVPNIIKVDVEGMEMEVLMGLLQTLRRPECRLICCEVHFAILEQMGQKDAPRRVLQLLDTSGFNRIEWVDSSHFLAFKHSSGGGE